VLVMATMDGAVSIWPLLPATLVARIA